MTPFGSARCEHLPAQNADGRYKFFTGPNRFCRDHSVSCSPRRNGHVDRRKESLLVELFLFAPVPGSGFTLFPCRRRPGCRQYSWVLKRPRHLLAHRTGDFTALKRLPFASVQRFGRKRARSGSGGFLFLPAMNSERRDLIRERARCPLPGHFRMACDLIVLTPIAEVGRTRLKKTTRLAGRNFPALKMRGESHETSI